MVELVSLYVVLLESQNVLTTLSEALYHVQMNSKVQKKTKQTSKHSCKLKRLARVSKSQQKGRQQNEATNV